MYDVQVLAVYRSVSSTSESSDAICLLKVFAYSAQNSEITSLTQSVGHRLIKRLKDFLSSVSPILMGKTSQSNLIGHADHANVN